MKKKASLFILIILFSLNILTWIVVFDLQRPHSFKVIFFDVGQGDAIFIETPARQQILIDGGPYSTILEKLAQEIPFYDRTIDLIILSHPEKDHLSGLNEVLKRYKIENILWTGIIRDTPEYKDWLNLIQKEGAEIKIAKVGQSVKLAQSHLNILYPLENLEGQEIKNSNDTSIVAKLMFGQNSFLFTGDISSNVEKELIFANLKSDVLKVAHHGSKYSSSEDFLESVLPQFAIIQVGKNSYGHPAEEALNRLENFGIRILRNDKDGDIEIVSDGIKIKIKNEVSNF